MGLQCGTGSLMAAMPLRQYESGRIEEESSTEVIYLLIPPSATFVKPIAKPWSLVERTALAYWNLRLGVRATPAGQSVRAMGLVAGYAMIAAPLLVAGYLLKSAIGFDLFPGTHMGGYVPIIGGH